MNAPVASPDPEQQARTLALANGGVLAVTGDDGPAGQARIGELRFNPVIGDWACVPDRWKNALPHYPRRTSAKRGIELVRKMTRCESAAEARRAR